MIIEGFAISKFFTNKIAQGNKSVDCSLEQTWLYYISLEKSMVFHRGKGPFRRVSYVCIPTYSIQAHEEENFNSSEREFKI